MRRRWRVRGDGGARDGVERGGRWGNTSQEGAEEGEQRKELKRRDGQGQRRRRGVETKAKAEGCVTSVLWGHLSPEYLLCSFSQELLGNFSDSGFRRVEEGGS